jgi:hypothetical protein
MPEQGSGSTGVAFPPVVYVPCESTSPVDGEISLDLRRMADGRTALLTYSALDRLVACCGPHQPWILLPAARLDEVDRRVHFDVILLDVAIPEDLWRTAGG